MGIISKLLALDKDQKAALVGRLVASVTASTPAPQAASAPAQRRSGGSKKGTALFCADHPNVQVIETKADVSPMEQEMAGLTEDYDMPF